MVRIEQSELYDNVLVSKFCVFLKRYNTVGKSLLLLLLLFFFLGGGGDISKKKKNSHHVFRLSLRG